MTKEINLAESVNLLRKISVEDQNIVNVDKTEQKISEHLIYQVLKGIAGIVESKGPPQNLKNPKGSDDGSLLYILRSHRNLVGSLL